MANISKKICLVGDFSVGKTSLIRRFVEDKFSDRYLSTVGVKISRKVVEFATNQINQSVNLLIWDIEGQTKFQSIAPSYLKGASGSIIVADITRPETLESLQRHLDLFFSVNPQGLVMVALNKSDLAVEEKLARIIQLYNFDLHPQVLATYVTSAKTGEYVELMFRQLAENMIKPLV
ncbi:MAG: Rab family GTPase [Xenococcaceae cyanobacterium MO_188.B29]|nr:Rab family GTPase [Xenococcaceae cyanobacterium MO_188.B29]